MLEYIVMSRQYVGDSGIPLCIPRYINHSPYKVLEAARRIFEQDRVSDVHWVESVIIYCLAAGQEYPIWDSSGTEDKPAKTIRYVAWTNDNGIVEHFYGDFAIFSAAAHEFKAKFDELFRKSRQVIPSPSPSA